eukprot:363762_1
MAETNHHCHVCLKQNVTSRCSRCKSIYYCGMQCQKKNWKEHKKQCKKMKQQHNQQVDTYISCPPKYVCNVCKMIGDHWVMQCPKSVQSKCKSKITKTQQQQKQIKHSKTQKYLDDIQIDNNKTKEINTGGNRHNVNPILFDNLLYIPPGYSYEYDSQSDIQDSDYEYDVKQADNYIQKIQNQSIYTRVSDMEQRIQKSENITAICQKELQNMEKNRKNIDSKLFESDFILLIYLRGIVPCIWRKIRVPAILSLAVFHDKILTQLFDYKRNFHAYVFLQRHRKNLKIGFGPVDSQSVDMTHIQTNLDALGSYMIDSQFVYLFDMLQNINDKLKYIYDLGDRFTHSIVVKDIIKHDKNDKLFEIIGGERCGPVENGGGNRSYAKDITKLGQIKTVSVNQLKLNDKQLIEKIMNAPNLCLRYGRKWFDVDEFYIDGLRRDVKECFLTELSLQDAASMYDQVAIMLGSNRVIRTCFKCREKKKDIEYITCQKCLSVFFCNEECVCQHYCFDHTNF